MDMTLEQIMSELRYTTGVEKILLQKICNHEKSVAKIAETAYCGENLDFPLCRRMPLTRLAVVTYLLLEIRENPGTRMKPGVPAHGASQFTTHLPLLQRQDGP